MKKCKTRTRLRQLRGGKLFARWISCKRCPEASQLRICVPFLSEQACGHSAESDRFEANMTSIIVDLLNIFSREHSRNRVLPSVVLCSPTHSTLTASNSTQTLLTPVSKGFPPALYTLFLLKATKLSGDDPPRLRFASLWCTVGAAALISNALFIPRA